MWLSSLCQSVSFENTWSLAALGVLFILIYWWFIQRKKNHHLLWFYGYGVVLSFFYQLFIFPYKTQYWPTLTSEEVILMAIIPGFIYIAFLSFKPSKGDEGSVIYNLIEGSMVFALILVLGWLFSPSCFSH